MSIYTYQIQELYVAYFGRPADADGLAFWEVQAANSGGSAATFAAMSAAFAGSAEYQATYAGLSPYQAVDVVYLHLLNRPTDAAGRQYWGDKLASGALTINNFVTAILNSALNGPNATDKATVDSKILASIAFTAALVTPQQKLAYTGADANAAEVAWLAGISDPASEAAATTPAALNATIDSLVNLHATFTLTPGKDNVNPSYPTYKTVIGDLSAYAYEGTGPTLNAGDVIRNVVNLNIGDQASTGIDLIPVGATLTNIQNITLTTNGNAGSGTGASWNTRGITGLVTSTVVSNGAHGDFVSADKTTNVVVNHNNTVYSGGVYSGIGSYRPAELSTASVVVLGGKDVTVTTVAGDVIVGNANPGSDPISTDLPSGVVTVTQGNTDDGGVYVHGGTDVVVNITSSSNYGDIQIGNTYENTGKTVGGVIADPTGNVTITDAGYGDILVHGGKNVTITDTALSGAGEIKVGSYYPINAADLPSGVVTITETAKYAFDGLSGLNHNDNDSGDIEVYGGTDVHVTTNGGNTIYIGGSSLNGNLPSGNVTVIDTGLATAMFSGGSGGNPTPSPIDSIYGSPYSDDPVSGDWGHYNGYIQIEGGHNVTVTTAGSAVNVGLNFDFSTFNVALDSPTGAVSVTETAAGALWTDNFIIIEGGSSVNVKSLGQDVHINRFGGTTSGNIVVNQAGGVFTGNNSSAGGEGSIHVESGNNVTVTTTGSDVEVGDIIWNGAVSVATGAISVTNTFSGAQGANLEEIHTLGGTSVSITVGAVDHKDGYYGEDSGPYTHAPAITVGVAKDHVGHNGEGYNSYDNDWDAALTSDGTALLDPSLYNTGDVTIVNARTDNGVTAYGSANTQVFTNGAVTVNIKGGSVSDIVDVQTTTGPAVGPGESSLGTSHLVNVIIDGNQGLALEDYSGGTVHTGTIIQTDALANLTITNSMSPDGSGDNVYYINDRTKAHSLALTVGGNQAIEVEDPTAGVVTVKDNGVAGKGIAELEMVTATAFSFANTAAQSFLLDENVALESITATNTGSLNLGDVSGLGALTTLDAHKASGAVTVEINGNLTAFTGGSGNDVVTVDFGAGTTTSIDGGTGVNTVILTDVAQTYVGLLGDPIKDAISHEFVNFQYLGLGSNASTNASGTYNVSGFTGVIVGDNKGDTLTLLNADAAETLQVTVDRGLDYINWIQAADTKSDSLTVTIGVDGKTDGIWAGYLYTGAGAAGNGAIETITIDSVGSGKGHNGIHLEGYSGGLTTTLNLLGNEDLRLDSDSASVTKITVTSTGAVDLTNASGTFSGSFDGLSVSSGGVSIDAHSSTGRLTVDLLASTGDNLNAVSSVITGTGGGDITLGGGSTHSGGSAGSNHITLTASTAVRDNLNVYTQSNNQDYGIQAEVNSFDTSASSHSDVIRYEHTAYVVDSTNGVTIGGNVYQIVNGVYSIVTYNGGNPVGSAAYNAELLSNVESDIFATAGHALGAITIGNNTYVVEGPHWNGGGSADVRDSVIQLSGVTSVLGFGQAYSDSNSTTSVSMGAGKTIMVDNLNWDNWVENNGSAITDKVYDDAGYMSDRLVNHATGVTNTFHELAAWAALYVDGTSGGDVVVDQVGASGTNALYVTTEYSGGGAFELDKLTVNGDWNLIVDANSGDATIHTVVDATNTMTTLSLVNNDNNDITIDNITSTSLKTIDASAMQGTGGAHLNLGLEDAHIAQAGLTILLGHDVNNTVYASGAADIIKESHGSSSNSNWIVAGGAGDIITLGDSGASGDHSWIDAAGKGDTITVGNGYNDINAIGAGDTINIKIGSGVTYVTVGTDATVNFTGTDTTHNDTIAVGAAVAGGTTASYHFTTVNGFALGDEISFHNSSADTVVLLNDVNYYPVTNTGHYGTGSLAQVNVATAATLADALNLAANITLLETAPGQTPFQLFGGKAVVDWFQFGGNTYIVESVSNASGVPFSAVQTHLDANDVVVKLTGLVDLSHATIGLHNDLITTV